MAMISFAQFLIFLGDAIVVEKARINWNMHMFHSNYKGHDIYKVHPQKGYGFDPAFVLWFTKYMNSEDRPIYKLTAYSLKALRELIDNEPKLKRSVAKRVLLVTSDRVKSRVTLRRKV